MRKVMLACAAVIALITFAQAQVTVRRYYSVDKLLTLCGGNSAMTREGCFGYIAGVADEFELARTLNGRPVCLPPDIAVEQLANVVLSYLRSRPDAFQYAAATYVSMAIMDRWDCKH